MADTVTQPKRSSIMKAVGNKNTKPEMIVRRYLHAQGFRFRIHSKKLSGTPDIVLAKYKYVIYINGCFWHGHEGCKKATVPKSNTDFWLNKLKRNKERDTVHANKLIDQGWKVITIWECELSNKQQLITLEKLKQDLIDEFSKKLFN
jgi:DNA mismatch endonuclease (patch repair protein)